MLKHKYIAGIIAIVFAIVLGGCVYGYTESDEISLLFHPDDNTFGRKTRKINSVLAGEASAHLSLHLGVADCFDSRVVPLSNLMCVKDFRPISV